MNPQPFIFTASPPPVPSVAAITSYVSSMMELRSQVIATIEQALSDALYTVGQVIAQEVSVVEQQVDRLLGINPNPTNQFPPAQPSSDSGAGRGHGSGMGSGGGAAATDHNTSSKQLNNSISQNGHGSGSGSSVTSAHPNGSGQGSIKMQPRASGGGVTGTTGYGSGTATIYGKVWLDSDYDGYIDNGELGYSGASVQIIEYDPTTGLYYDYGPPVITDANGNYSSIVAASPTDASYYEIQVLFPWSFFATQEGGDSLIDAQGYSPLYAVFMGGAQKINAGISSMNVNTTADDANNQKIQNKVTLRDAIQTGNNGPPQPAVTFYSAPNTPLNGTIFLQAQQLDPIKASYDIAGPGASTLTVNGNLDSGTIFRVNSGVTTTISGLTITGGMDTTGTSGGGIYNDGNLTLTNDQITSNRSFGFGGGIYNASQLTLQGATISNNTADDDGGGIQNYGKANIADSTIENNKSTSGSGGGVFNTGATATLSSVVVSGNTAQEGGGGIYVLGGTLTLKNNFSIGLSLSGDSNKAIDGGGIYVEAGRVKMTNGYVSNNSAAWTSSGGKQFFGMGGGIYVQGGTLTLNAVTIQNNTVAPAWPGAAGGGGIAITGTGADVSISGGAILYNFAENLKGGGIYTDAGSLTLKNNVLIEDNSATGIGGQGAGMYLGNGSNTTFSWATVNGNKGFGVYQQTDATVNTLPPAGLIDNQDPDGKPVQGP